MPLQELCFRFSAVKGNIQHEHIAPSCASLVIKTVKKKKKKKKSNGIISFTFLGKVNEKYKVVI